MRLSVCDNNVGLTLDHRLYQVTDSPLRILVVAVSVNYDVGTELQSLENPVVERSAQPLVADMMHEVFDAVPTGYLYRSIRRTVIDHQCYDFIHPWNLLGYTLQHQRQRGLFVKAGYLNNELHDLNQYILQG
jgi:hypothetical protein